MLPRYLLLPHQREVVGVGPASVDHKVGVGDLRDVDVISVKDCLREWQLPGSLPSSAQRCRGSYNLTARRCWKVPQFISWLISHEIQSFMHPSSVCYFHNPRPLKENY